MDRRRHARALHFGYNKWNRDRGFSMFQVPMNLMDDRLTETNKCGVGTALGNEWNRTPSPRVGSSIGGFLPRVKAHLGNRL